MARYARHFGLGSKTGVELSGEVAGLVASRETEDYWALGHTLSASIGQSNNDFTPIQMAKYIAMIANGGNNLNITVILRRWLVFLPR